MNPFALEITDVSRIDVGEMLLEYFQVELKLFVGGRLVQSTKERGELFCLYG